MTEAAKKVPADAILVEIGPHSILRSPLRQTRPDLSYVNAMRKGECGLQSLSAAVGELWRKGAQVDWRTEATPTNEVGAERKFLPPCTLHPWLHPPSGSIGKKVHA